MTTTQTTTRETEIVTAHAIAEGSDWFIAVGRFTKSGQYFVARGQGNTYMPIGVVHTTEAAARAAANIEWTADHASVTAQRAETVARIAAYEARRVA